MKIQDIIKFSVDVGTIDDGLGLKKVGTRPSKHAMALSTQPSGKVSISVVRAMSLLAVPENTKDIFLPNTFTSCAIGTAFVPNPNEVRPEIYIVGEFHDKDGFVYIVLFSDREKKLYFVRTVEQEQAMVEPVSVDGSQHSPTHYIIGTLFRDVLVDSDNECASLYNEIYPEMKVRAKNGSFDRSIDEMTDLFGALTDNLYYRMKMRQADASCSLSYLLKPEKATAFHGFDREFLDSLRIKNTTLGKFTFIKLASGDEQDPYGKSRETIQKENAAWFDSHRGKYTLDTSRVLSEDEKLLVPQFDSHFTPNKSIARIAKIIHATPDMRDLEFCGPAGGGKSVGAKMLAYMLGVPYRVFTCSPGLDESDLFGHYTPSTAPTSSRNLSSATYKKCADLEGDPMSLENIAIKILRFPPVNDIRSDPRTVYQIMTGREIGNNEKVTPRKVMDLYYQLAAEEYAKIVNEVKGKSEKSLVFVKSPIVKALENGDLVEVQEQNALSPGTLLGFNDLRDRHSSGYQLPNGEVLYRNPNAIIVMTSNVEYEGCRPMNSSVVSRSNLSIAFPALSSEEMAARAAAVTGFDDAENLHEMADFILDVKNIMAQNAINDASDIGVRELINWCYATQAIGSIYHACIDAVINKASYIDEYREMFRTRLDNSKFYTMSLAYDEEAF